MTNYGMLYDVFIRSACFIVVIIFIVRFSRVNWRATEDGKHIMAFTAMIGGFLLLIILTWIFGRVWWIIWSGRILFMWALYLLIQRVLLQRKAQKELASDEPEVNHQSQEQKGTT